METSESAYVSNVLETRLRVEPLIQNIDGIGLSKPLFQQILAQANPNGLELVVAEIAKQNIPLAFELLGLELSIPTLHSYMKEILQAWGWFRISVIRREQLYEVKLFHDYGYHWSLFLKAYFSSAYEVVSRNSPSITIAGKVVKISLPIDTCRELSSIPLIAGVGMDLDSDQFVWAQ